MAKAVDRPKATESIPFRLQYDFLDSLTSAQEEALFSRALSRLEGELFFGLGVLGVLGPAQQEAVDRLKNLPFEALPGDSSRERFDALCEKIVSFAPPTSCLAIFLKAGYLLGTIAAGLEKHSTSGGGGSKRAGYKGPAKTYIEGAGKAFYAMPRDWGLKMAQELRLETRADVTLWLMMIGEAICEGRKVKLPAAFIKDITDALSTAKVLKIQVDEEAATVAVNGARGVLLSTLLRSLPKPTTEKHE